MESIQELDTSGARAVEVFEHAGTHYLVVPQLAEDVPGQPALMTLGNSNVDALVYRWENGRFIEHARLPVPGGEDAEFFSIGTRAFVATASLRTGADPYSLHTQSTIFELIDARFEVFQQVPTVAAKQWTHFRIGERRFLALAQGASHTEADAGSDGQSCIFEWDGDTFRPFQTVRSGWGYNWAFFEIGDEKLLAYADHAVPSQLLRWNGERFEPFQELTGKSGRAFCHFESGGTHWLAFACLLDDSTLYRWSEGRFVLHQKLSGPGGREFEWIPHGDGGWLVQINFLQGSREAPVTQLQSVIYRMQHGRLREAHTFPTSGGTDACTFEADGHRYLVVANSLSTDVRFHTPSRVYRLELSPSSSVAHQSPELLRLFETYTGGPQSIGANLATMTGAATAADPLIVATNADIVLFPGRGRDPEVEGFRLSTRGFKELAGISHHGPAVASILQMRLVEPDGMLWRREAERLIAATRDAREANSVALWRDVISVAAYRGREERIAELVHYSCALTERYLERVLAQPDLFTAADMREHYLEATGSAVGATVPMNAVMIATFFLVGMDISHRVMAWLDSHRIDWSRAMALVIGRQGRPTAGVTWTTNSVCAMILGASRQQLALDRLFIAPHAQTLPPEAASDLAALRAFEIPMRSLWAHTRAVSELGALMYEGYPRYEPQSTMRPVLTADTLAVAEMPAITGPDDWRALNTRLRVVLEDPRQLLSGCVTDFAVDQLQANDNDPARITVPGLDATTYPPLP